MPAPRQTARLPGFLNSRLRPIQSQVRFYAGSSYGDGEGDPKGENPMQQGPNPSEHLEHPGPPPPNTKPQDAPSKGNSPSSSSTQKDAINIESSSTGASGQSEASHRGPKNGAQPRILDESPPSQESEEVKRHNEEFEKRPDRASNRINPDGKDNVGKGFWSGTGGRDGK